MVEPKYKVRDWVVVKGYRDGEIGYIDKVDPSEQVPYTVAFPSPKGGSSFYEEENLVPLEPTPPSQIEEESQTQRSLREMYELGKEHGRNLALKDMEIERLIKEIEELK